MVRRRAILGALITRGPGEEGLRSDYPPFVLLGLRRVFNIEACQTNVSPYGIQNKYQLLKIVLGLRFSRLPELLQIFKI